MPRTERPDVERADSTHPVEGEERLLDLRHREVRRGRLEEDVARVAQKPDGADHEDGNDEKARERIDDRRHAETNRQAGRKRGE